MAELSVPMVEDSSALYPPLMTAPSAGDPCYDGFRFDELWIATGLVDNQETIIYVADPTTGQVQPLLATDRVRLESFVIPMVKRAAEPLTIKHFRLVRD